MSSPKASYSGSDPYVVVSYAHADLSVVSADLRFLQDEGCNVWYDEGIGAGLSWRDEVALAISECSLFVIFLTRNSISSEVCRQELFLALSRERRVLVVYLEDCQISPGMELGLSDKQAILKYQLEEREYRRKLLQAVKAFQLDAPTRAAGPAGLQERDGIAILPLTTRGGGEQIASLSEGIAEELLNCMTRVPGLRVVSGFGFRNLDLDIRNIGLRFGVGQVLDGSIQQAGDRIRINMRLADTSGGDSLWASRFDFELDDIFAVQDKVAAEVLTALRVLETDQVVTPEFGTVSTEAYEAFLLGLFAKRKYERREIEQAMRHLAHAISIDPGFSRAWYTLGLCAWELTVFEGPGPELIARAEAAFDKAREQGYQPELPWIQIERKLHPERRPSQRALAEEALGVIVDGTDAWQQYELVQIGRCLGAAGLFQASYDFLNAYLARVPLPLKEVDEVRQDAEGLLPVLGRFNEAIKRLNDRLEQVPDDVDARLQRCMLYSRTGQYTRAGSDIEVLGKSALADFGQFYMLFWQEDMDGARTYREKLLASQDLRLRFKFRCCALLDEYEEAIRYMDESADRGAPLFYVRALVSNALPGKRLAAFESSPGFKSFLAQRGVDDAWPAELAAMVNQHTELTEILVELP